MFIMAGEDDRAVKFTSQKTRIILNQDQEGVTARYSPQRQFFTSLLLPLPLPLHTSLTSKWPIENLNPSGNLTIHQVKILMIHWVSKNFHRKIQKYVLPTSQAFLKPIKFTIYIIHHIIVAILLEGRMHRQGQNTCAIPILPLLQDRIAQCQK